MSETQPGGPGQEQFQRKPFLDDIHDLKVVHADGLRGLAYQLSEKIKAAKARYLKGANPEIPTEDKLQKGIKPTESLEFFFGEGPLIPTEDSFKKTENSFKK